MNYLKIGAVLSFIVFLGTTTNAQQVTGNVGATEKKGQSSALNGTIRVVDNKGTKKYLQVQNGITLLTDVNPDGGIVSTWQLGGSLKNSTYIDVNNNSFSLDGLTLVAGTSNPSTNATSLSVGSEAIAKGSAGTAARGTGWTVLIRDEATGALQKIELANLVKGGSIDATATTNGVAPTLTDPTIPADVAKISVYRNGAKLRAGTDYTVVGVAGSRTVTLVPSTTAPNDWEIYADDFFEVQWVL